MNTYIMREIYNPQPILNTQYNLLDGEKNIF